MATEELDLDFTDQAIDALADIAVELNSSVENIGARPVADRNGKGVGGNYPSTPRTGLVIVIKIDAEFVRKNVGDLAKNTDLSRYIL